MNIDSGDTAWLLASSALVLFMTPGVGFFYAGMVQAKNVLAVLLQSFVCMGVVTITWVAVGFSLSFGADSHGLIGNLQFSGLENVAAIPGYTSITIPPILFVLFQLTFAIITPALITGAIAERMKFMPFVVLVAVWSLVVYAPIAHWVFSPNGWLMQRGAQDFAGGAVVHINSGTAALALAIVLGKRRGWARAVAPVHNLPFVLLGTAILVFGWFGFNAGSALKADGSAALAAANSVFAASSAFLAWICIERVRGGRVTALGSASGLVAGLVAITPAAGYVTPLGALAIGLVAGAVCLFACRLKFSLKFDDALDVIGVHLCGGIIGALAIGLLGTSRVGGADGLFYGGGLDLLAEQALSIAVVMAYSFTTTFMIAIVISKLSGGLRVSDEHEHHGLDRSLHGEVAYDFGSSGPDTFVPRVVDPSARFGVKEQSAEAVLEPRTDA